VTGAPLHLLYIVYGLAFFWLGANLWAQLPMLSDPRLARCLRWLALFGLLHGVHELLDLELLHEQAARIFLPAHGKSPTEAISLWERLPAARATVPAGAESRPQAAPTEWGRYLFSRKLPLILLLTVTANGLSYLALLRFGLGGLVSDKGRWAQSLTLTVLLVWLVLLGMDWRSPIPLSHSEVAECYLLGLPAILLAVLRLSACHGFQCVEPRVSRQLRQAGWWLGAYGILDLFGPPAAFFPASYINDQAFMDATGLPVELFRTLCALALSRLLSQALGVNERLIREKNHAFLDSILRSSVKLAIAATDTHFVVRFQNLEAQRLSRRTPAEVLGRTVMEIHAEEGVAPERFERAIAIVLAEGEYSYEVDRSVQGQRQVVATRVSAIRYANGALAGFLLVGQDITTRRLAEEELQQIREHLDRLVQERTTELEEANRLLRERAILLHRYETIIAASTDHISFVDTQYRYQAVNETYLVCHGRARTDIVGHTVADLFGQEVFAAIRPHLDRCLAGEEVNYQAWFSFPGQRQRWMDVSYSPCRAEDGRITGLVVIGRDATHRRQAEEALAEIAKFPEQNPHPVFRVDRQGQVLYANPQARRLLSQGKGGTVSPIVDAPWRTIIARALETGRMEIMETRLGEHVISLSVAPFPESGYVNLYGMDISALKQLLGLVEERQAEVERLNRDLAAQVREEVEKNRRKDFVLMHQSRLAAMGEMIGNIAHQWRQPLNTLSILITNVEDALLLGPLDPQELADQFIKGRDIITRMSSTIDDFRRFFKPDKQLERFLPARAIRNALALVEASLAQAQVTLHFQEPTEPMETLGYANEYAQVILIMLVNAKEAIREWGIKDGRVDISLREEGSELVVRIQDNGGGIPEEVLARIFEPYFTTKGAQGTGIGLYMAKLIIEDHMSGQVLARNCEAGAEIEIRTPRDTGK